MTVSFGGSEEKAIEYICSLYGLYFNTSPLFSSKRINKNMSRIKNYISKIQLSPWTGLSWFDTLKDRQNQKDTDIDLSDEPEESDFCKVTPKLIKFWGTGYDQPVYITLQGYYDELLKLCDGKPDTKKQKMMKSLCLIEYQMQINIQNGKDIGTLANSYKSMFEAAELKVDISDTSNDSFGKWIMEIEKYCPAEYYKDKKKYHDFFGIIEYIERFMFRPLRNLIFGTKEKEKEYWINDDIDGDANG